MIKQKSLRVIGMLAIAALLFVSLAATSVVTSDSAFAGKPDKGEKAPKEKGGGNEFWD